MTVIEAYRYIQDRLNVLGTNKGDNIPKHTFVRTFNAMQELWVEERVKLSDTNRTRIDELQRLISNVESTLQKENNYWFIDLPEDYYHSYRVDAFAPCLLTSYHKKEADINQLLNDEFWKPSLEWGETLYTISQNKLKIYGDFTINSVNFYYFRRPRKINMADGGLDENGNPNVDIDPEFVSSSLLDILNKTVAQLALDNGDQRYVPYEQNNQRMP
jgi:hypothetical protein